MARVFARGIWIAPSCGRNVAAFARVLRRSGGVLRRNVAAAVTATALAGLGAALVPGQAVAGSGFILSTKSIAAPAGFHGICERYTWACAVRSSAERRIADSDLRALADRVNRSVNRQVAEVSDQKQYRRSEVWALPTRRGGDCEDFALLKKRELIRHGVSPDRLLIATALTETREPHAVLILRTGQGDLVLDNRTDRMKPWRQTGYSFLRMQDPQAPERWQMIMAGGLFG